MTQHDQTARQKALEDMPKFDSENIFQNMGEAIGWINSNRELLKAVLQVAPPVTEGVFLPGIIPSATSTTNAKSQPPEDVSEDERGSDRFKRAYNWISRFGIYDCDGDHCAAHTIDAVLDALARARSDERVVSREDAKAALVVLEHSTITGQLKRNVPQKFETIRALLTAAAKE